MLCHRVPCFFCCPQQACPQQACPQPKFLLNVFAFELKYKNKKRNDEFHEIASEILSRTVARARSGEFSGPHSRRYGILHKIAVLKSQNSHKGKGKCGRSKREKGKAAGPKRERGKCPDCLFGPDLTTLWHRASHARTRRNDFPVGGPGGLTPQPPICVERFVVVDCCCFLIILIVGPP